MDNDRIDTVCSKLEKIEDLLTQIEVNGRGDDYEERHINRKDIDGEQVVVHIRCNVIQVGDINNVTQEFKAELYIAVRYREPNLKGVRSDTNINWSEHWRPRIVFPNMVTTCELIKRVYLSGDNDGSDVPMVIRSFRVIGVFKEKLELEDFPLDIQELNVVLMSDWPEKDVKFAKDMLIKDSINTSNFTDSQTWELRNHVLSRPVQVAKDESGSHRRYPVYTITFHVKRKIGYYFWNIVFVTGIIMFLTFSSFAVKATETGDRLSVTVTLLLTSVAFKFVVSQNLPTISYLTVLDIYVLMCMVFQCLMAVQNSVSSIWADDLYGAQAQRFDMISAVVLIMSVVIFHVIMVIVMAVKVRKRNGILSAANRSYQDICNHINTDYHRRKQEARNKQNDCDDAHLNYDHIDDDLGASHAQLQVQEVRKKESKHDVNGKLLRKNVVGDSYRY